MTDDELRDEVMRLHDRAYNPDFEVNDLAGLFFLKPLTPEAHAWVTQHMQGHRQISHEAALIIEDGGRAEAILKDVEAAGMWWTAKP